MVEGNQLFGQFLAVVQVRLTRLLLSEGSRHRPAIAGEMVPPAIIPYAVP